MSSALEVFYKNAGKSRAADPRDVEAACFARPRFFFARGFLKSAPHARQNLCGAPNAYLCRACHKRTDAGSTDVRQRFYEFPIAIPTISAMTSSAATV